MAVTDPQKANLLANTIKNNFIENNRMQDNYDQDDEVVTSAVNRYLSLFPPSTQIEPVMPDEIINFIKNTSSKKAPSCNPKTIRRVLRKAGYHGQNMRRKPFVSKVNRKKRIDFAKENEKQDRIFLNSVIFSDESKFNIHGSDGHQKVWSQANAALEPKNMRGTVKHGGS
ncbi:transposable element Tc1 transposase [Trichonephila clavipes]|nr:transposable element Tc1 transposase [Trichonephila clavipes]